MAPLTIMMELGGFKVSTHPAAAALTIVISHQAELRSLMSEANLQPTPIKPLVTQTRLH